MKETRAQLIERLERLDTTYISTDDLYILNGDAMRLIRDNQARERVLVEALTKLSFAAQTSGGTAGRDEHLCACIEHTQQTIARINSGDWIES